MAEIKGLFIKEHIKRLQKIKGKDIINELEKKVGQSLNVTYLDYYPAKLEENVILKSLEILNQSTKYGDKDFTAGIYHFETFIHTFYAENLVKLIHKDVLTGLKLSKAVFGTIFKGGVEVEIIDKGNNSAVINLISSNYQLNHFKGFYTAIINFIGFNADIVAKQISPDNYEYTITWFPK